MINDMRTMLGEHAQCLNCLHCAGSFADQENRIWTVCDIRACIHERGREE